MSLPIAAVHLDASDQNDAVDGFVEPMRDCQVEESAFVEGQVVDMGDHIAADFQHELKHCISGLSVWAGEAELAPCMCTFLCEEVAEGCSMLVVLPCDM